MKMANLPNRYSWRAKGLWCMRRHGPVIAQCTDSVVFQSESLWLF